MKTNANSTASLEPNARAADFVVMLDDAASSRRGIASSEIE
jgi:hypothetical protein